MNKIKNWYQQYKGFIITAIVMIAIFFIGISIVILAKRQVISDYKTQLEQNNIEKEKYKTKILELNDSIAYWENLANSAILKDTIFITKITREKNKTNEELNVIAAIPHDSSLILHAKLTQEYIQTGFAPDSTN